MNLEWNHTWLEHQETRQNFCLVFVTALIGLLKLKVLEPKRPIKWPIVCLSREHSQTTIVASFCLSAAGYFLQDKQKFFQSEQWIWIMFWQKHTHVHKKSWSVLNVNSKLRKWLACSGEKEIRILCACSQTSCLPQVTKSQMAFTFTICTNWRAEIVWHSRESGRVETNISIWPDGAVFTFASRGLSSWDRWVGTRW